MSEFEMLLNKKDSEMESLKRKYEATDNWVKVFIERRGYYPSEEDFALQKERRLARAK